MAKWLTILACGLGLTVFAGAVVAPMVGLAITGAGLGREVAAPVPLPSGWMLLAHSVTLSAVAAIAAIILGIAPAAVLGSVRAHWRPIVLGLILAPLLLPSQIHAYAWDLALGNAGIVGRWLPQPLFDTAWARTVQAGLISAGWLWPVVALIVGAGWRVVGRTSYTLAILDTTPTRAYLKAVLPGLRHHLLAAVCVVFAITLIEYPIPHLTLCRVYSTELVVLAESAAPASQLMQITVQVVMLVVVLVAIVAQSLRAAARFQPVDAQDHPWTANTARHDSRPPRTACVLALCVWCASLLLPAVAMWLAMRDSTAWRQAFSLFAREWTISLAVALAAALLSVAMAVATVLLGRASNRPWLARLGIAGAMTALCPPAILGIALIAAFNRPGLLGYLYDVTPVVWIMGLVARYGLVAMLVVWTSLGSRRMLLVEQARVDGADTCQILVLILLRMLQPVLLAAVLVVMLLSLFEVVVTHLAGPVGFPSLSLTLLNHMHYGRDDVVIATSLTVMGLGVLLTLTCGWLVNARNRA